MNEPISDMEASDYQAEEADRDTCEAETTPVFRKVRTDRRLDLIAQVHETRGWGPPKR